MFWLILYFMQFLCYHSLHWVYLINYSVNSGQMSSSLSFSRWRYRVSFRLPWHIINVFLKWSNLMLSWAHLPLLGTLIWPWPTWPLTLAHVTFDLEVKSQWNCTAEIIFCPVYFDAVTDKKQYIMYDHKHRWAKKKKKKRSTAMSNPGP